MSNYMNIMLFGLGFIRKNVSAAHPAIEILRKSPRTYTEIKKRATVTKDIQTQRISPKTVPCAIFQIKSSMDTIYWHMNALLGVQI